MAISERQQSVLELLKQLKGLEPLKELFWTELNYDRVNEPLSRRGWTEGTANILADDPVLFAGGGQDNTFHIIYSRLASDQLLTGSERPVVTKLLHDHPYALFIFSNQDQDRWHFINVRYDEQAANRRLFRRITVSPTGLLRTASERISLLDLGSITGELFGLSPLAIQKRHDEAFDVESVTKAFYKELANWYFWARECVVFPKDAKPDADGKPSVHLIRFITQSRRMSRPVGGVIHSKYSRATSKDMSPEAIWK